jgi:hypothetical protein
MAIEAWGKGGARKATRRPSPPAGPRRLTHPTRADRRRRLPAATGPWSRSSCPRRRPYCASRKSTPPGRSLLPPHGLLCGDPRHCSLQMDDAHQGAPDTGRAWTRRPRLNRLVEVRSLRLGSDIVRPRLHAAGQHAAGSGAAAPGLAPRRLLVIPPDSRTSSPIAIACHGEFPGHSGGLPSRSTR